MYEASPGKRSVPLPRGLRAWAASNTPLVPAAQSQPFFRGKLQLPIKLLAGLLAVDEIAESTSHTPFAAIQSAACFSEIRDGR